MASFHVRSVSLPSKSHPLISQFNECMCRLTDAEATNSTSLSSMSLKLSSLESLYECVDDLLLLPHAQQVFTQELVDELLDGYLRLLDASETTKDVFSHTKQDLQHVLSVLRRRQDANVLSDFSVSRRKVKKMVKKSQKTISSLQRNCVVEGLEKDNETISVIRMLKEVESITLNLLESLLSYIAGKRGQSLVSRLMGSRRVSCDDTEFDRVEAMLISFTGGKTNKSDDIENVQNELKEMESSIQILEEGLETLFKRLIKTRVSLLNILTH